MPLEAQGSRDNLEASHLVDTPGSVDKLQAPQVTQVDMPSLFLIPVVPSPSDYLHSPRTDKQ